MPRKLGKKEGRKRKKDQKKEGRQGLRDQHDSNYIRLTAITGQTSKRKAYGHTQFKIYVYALFVNSDCISKMDIVTMTSPTGWWATNILNPSTIAIMFYVFVFLIFLTPQSEQCHSLLFL